MAEPIELSAVRSDAEAASDPSSAAVASTTARALSLGSALATPNALRGMNRELAAIGLLRTPAAWGGWEQRKEILAGSDDILGRYHLLDQIRSREEERWVVSDVPQWSARVDLWRSVAVSRRQDEAVAWRPRLQRSHSRSGRRPGVLPSLTLSVAPGKYCLHTQNQEILMRR
jgi:hypothetical protein